VHKDKNIKKAASKRERKLGMRRKKVVKYFFSHAEQITSRHFFRTSYSLNPEKEEEKKVENERQEHLF
jgi:hypothetical protein